MASGVVRAAVVSILEDADFSLAMPRMILAKESARALLSAVEATEKNRDIFDDFAALLIAQIESTAVVPQAETSCRSHRKRMWSSFHRFINCICMLYPSPVNN